MARYDDEFKRQAVERYREARPGERSDAAAFRLVAKEFNIPAATLRDWVKAAPEPEGEALRGEVLVFRPSTAGSGGVGPSVVEVVGAPDPETLEGAFVQAVADMAWLEDSDGALVAAGRKIAKNVDEVLGSLDADGTAKTKALYLTPHFVNILRELGGTPATRKDLTQGEQKVTGKLAAMRAADKDRTRRRAN